MPVNWPLATAAVFLSIRAAPAADVSFQKDISPIFEQACAKCHLGDMAMGKLRLDSEADILKGGVSGPAVVAGKSGDSLLVKRILGLNDAPRMPMGGSPLSDAQVKLIRAWVDQGKFDTSAGERCRFCGRHSGEGIDGVRDQSAPDSGRPLLFLPRAEPPAKRSASRFLARSSQRQ